MMVSDMLLGTLKDLSFSENVRNNASFSLDSDLSSKEATLKNNKDTYRYQL